MFPLSQKEKLGRDFIDEKESDEEDTDIDMDACDPRLLDAMDQSLANIFHQKKQKEQQKKEKKALEESIVHFKLRVLDLVDIFIRKQSKDRKVLVSLIKNTLSISVLNNRSSVLSPFEICYLFLFSLYLPIVVVESRPPHHIRSGELSAEFLFYCFIILYYFSNC